MTNRPVPSFHVTSFGRLLAALLLGLATGPPLGAEEPESFDIDVRSEVDQRWHGVHKDGPIDGEEVRVNSAQQSRVTIAPLKVLEMGVKDPAKGK